VPLAMGREVIFLQATLFIRDMKMTSPPVARYFGELALLTNKKRAATIRAASAHRAPNAPSPRLTPAPPASCVVFGRRHHMLLCQIYAEQCAQCLV
jgi:hypothetical protein